MKSCCDSIIRRLLAFVVVAFVAVALPGCLDPIVADMEAEHQKLGRACQQEIQQSRYGSPQTSQVETLFPAP
jgi:hypothetical protein